MRAALAGIVATAMASEAGHEVDYLELPTNHFGIRDDPRTWELVDRFLARQLRPGT